MGKHTFELLSTTDPRWIERVLADFDTFLVDHAGCERKANALLMSLIAKYPEPRRILGRAAPLRPDGLETFARDMSLMAPPRLRLGHERPRPYVNELLAMARHGRDERFIDRFLISAIIEKRGAERFRIIAERISDPALAAFYDKLWRSEVKHAQVLLFLPKQG